MKDQRILLNVALGIMLLTGCSGPADEDISFTPGFEGENVSLSLSGEGYVDSAQIFFFKELETRDSLIYRETVHGITFLGNTFDFTLPVGHYKVFVFGNVGTRYIKASPPYSSSDILIDYGGGEEPEVIYSTRGTMNIGGQDNIKMGMILATSSVDLTIKSVPEGVKSIHVDLYNTGGGMYVDTRYWSKITDPNLSLTVDDVRADSTYIVSFSCFPTVKELGLSSLKVICYDDQGNIKYTGTSSAFSANSRRKVVVACNFTAHDAVTLKATGISDFILKPVVKLK